MRALGEPGGACSCSTGTPDCARFADELGIPHLELPELRRPAAVRGRAGARRPRWREVRSGDPRAADARVRRGGRHRAVLPRTDRAARRPPLLRLTPPRALLSVERRRALVGHGERARRRCSRVREAIAHARRHMPGAATAAHGRCDADLGFARGRRLRPPCRAAPPRPRRAARERRRVRARPARGRSLVPPAAPARRRRVPRVGGRGRRGARVRRRERRAGRAVRRRHEPRRPRDPAPRRDQPRPHAHERDRRAAPRGSHGDRPAGRDAIAARGRGWAARPLLPGRSGRRRDARRHGGDECERHDDRAVRRHACPCARARGRARRRADRPHRHACGEDVGGLQPHESLRRLRGHARRHHRADAPATSDSRSHRRRARRVPFGRGCLPRRGGDHRRRRAGAALRAARCGDDRARSTRSAGRHSRSRRTSSSSSAAAKPASRATSRRRASSPRTRARRHSSRRATRPRARRCGALATTH